MPDLLFFFLQGFDFSAGVDDRTVILASKNGSDLGKGIMEQFSAEIHGHLSGKNNVLSAGGGENVRARYTQMISNYGNDHFMGQLGGRLGIESFENIDEVFLAHPGRNEVLEGQYLDQAPLQTAKIRKMLGQGEHLFVAEFDVPFLTCFVDKLKTDIKVRPLEGDHESPPKARLETGFQKIHLRYPPAGGQDDLLAGFVKGIEQGEKVMLTLLEGLDFLEIINDQNIGIENFLEFRHEADFFAQTLKCSPKNIFGSGAPFQCIEDGLAKMCLA